MYSTVHKYTCVLDYNSIHHQHDQKGKIKTKGDSTSEVSSYDKSNKNTQNQHQILQVSNYITGSPLHSYTTLIVKTKFNSKISTNYHNNY